MNDGIFVSYSHRDGKTVEKIVSILKDNTHKEVWFDHNLRGGENYFSVIANQIIENQYFVFFVSENSVESDWCVRELEFAASEKRTIIAIWLDNIEISPRIKLVIQNTHYINWYSTTDELFWQAVSLAFSSSAVSNSAANSDRSYDEVVPEMQKYFLSRQDLKKIYSLLRAEDTGKYSVCFIPENANLLGIAYELGISVEPDPKKAALYYKASKYSGNFDGQYLYAAIKRQAEPENQEYLSEMLDAAEKGSVLALTHMGDCYYEGKAGLSADISKAYRYFERAARANGVLAMYYTAYGYRHGECLPKDLELAYMYTLKAKENGLPRAYRLLAFMYEEGQYVGKDLQKAQELFDEAINRGDYLSYCFKGALYGEMNRPDKKVELYKKAAELAEEGKIESGTPFYRLAVLYDNGEDVEQNFETAADYYIKAAERNHGNAKKWLVPCVMNLDGDKKSKYLNKAFELKCEKAAYELGIIEKNKRADEFERLSEDAIRYFETGAEQGDMHCVLELLQDYSCAIGNGCRDGSNRSDRINAIKWFGFFFANVDKDFLDSCGHEFLSTYYCAYAFELDYDPDFNMPDRELVLYYFRKSVDECPVHLEKIIKFAVDGYLFPNVSGSKLTVDVIHAEELLVLAQDNLDEFLVYIRERYPEDYLDNWKRIRETLIRGYLFISSCYEDGRYISANPEKAEKYKYLAKNLYRKSN